MSEHTKPDWPSNRFKRTVYFRGPIAAEMHREAVRLQLSACQLARKIWKIARAEIRNLPGQP
jgi:hypothetical protein